MGDKKFTFLEVHLTGDTQFGPSHLGEEGPALEPYEEDESLEASGGGGRKKGIVLAGLIGLVMLVGGAAVVRRLMEAEEFEETLEERELTID